MSLFSVKHFYIHNFAYIFLTITQRNKYNCKKLMNSIYTFGTTVCRNIKQILNVLLQILQQFLISKSE